MDHEIAIVICKIQFVVRAWGWEGACYVLGRQSELSSSCPGCIQFGLSWLAVST